MSIRLCSVDDCSKKHFCKGFCKLHFDRWHRHGSPFVVLKKLSTRGAPLAWINEHQIYAGDDCLSWPFSTTADGRPHMNGAVPARIMCERVNGPPPTPTHEAAHNCGKGHEACMNPNHLRWATPLENNSDMDIHGTRAVGELLPQSKLTADQVRQIRALGGELKQRDIATRFGVNISCVNKILNRKLWTHVS